MEIKRNGNWVTVTEGNLEVQAKVHDTSICTHLEANGKAVSKMTVLENGEKVYNYDRGLDYDNTTLEQMAFVERAALHF